MVTRTDGFMIALAFVILIGVALLIPYGNPYLRGAAGLVCSLVFIGTYVLIRKSDDQITVEASLERAITDAAKAKKTAQFIKGTEDQKNVNEITEIIGRIVMKCLKLIKAKDIGWKLIAKEARDTELYAHSVLDLVRILTGETSLPATKRREVLAQITKHNLPETLTSLNRLEEAVDKASGSEQEWASTSAELKLLNTIYAKTNQAEATIAALNTIFGKENL